MSAKHHSSWALVYKQCICMHHLSQVELQQLLNSTELILLLPDGIGKA